MEYKKVLEKALRIQRKISALGLDIKVGVGVGYEADEPFIYIQKTGNINNIHFVDSLNLNDKEFILRAKAMCEPKFTQLKKLCVDSFDIDLYLDKKEIVSVKSILSKEIALLTDDREVEISRLFIKD